MPVRHLAPTFNAPSLKEDSASIHEADSEPIQKVDESKGLAAQWYMDGNSLVQEPDPLSSLLDGKPKTIDVKHFGANISAAHTRLSGVTDPFPKVALIDTGLAPEAAAMEGAQVVSRSDLSGPSGKAEDSITHGTGNALTIGAQKNGVGIVGVAPGAPLVIVKPARDDVLAGSKMTFDEFAKAVDVAVANGARVVNISMSRDVAAWPLAKAEALFKKYEAKVLFVVSAGNDGADLSTVDPSLRLVPATVRANNVISVGGFDESGRRVRSSNYGAWVDVFAPGDQILQWRNQGPSGLHLSFQRGTSQAAPIVAGIAALVLRANSKLTPSEVRSMIIATAPVQTSMGGKQVDAAAAVEKALATRTPAIAS